MAVEGARDDERGPHDRSASLVPFERGAEGAAPHAGGPVPPVPPDGTPPGPGPRSGGAARRVGARTQRYVRALTERVIELAPRVPVRDVETLHRQFPGLSTEELADRLVAGATRSAAAVGAGVGGAAMLPVPPALPAELTAEIVGVAGVELKLIAELHEVYGRRAPGNVRERAAAYLSAWASERGIEVTRPATLSAAMNGELRRRLRRQITKRTLRTLPNLAPFLIGAAAGAVLNRRDTARLAERVRADLRAGATGPHSG
ncbi:hypothetical protein [Streptomyces qinglanensis]|uniref:EcsC protein family protein n=1 Tax=Streptomyces qinglanensis TaxID=943816 RepID=A0A1H9WP95_9ACTN|nr:hypothetical protein [Streptomyces qinglanensis]SES35517.1 hypothetical protein SAMN05421870_11938 [Streptomyces qinglanensis]